MKVLSHQKYRRSFWVYQALSGGFYSRDKSIDEIPMGWEGLKKITTTSLMHAKRHSKPSQEPPHPHDGLVNGRWVEVEAVMDFKIKE